MPQLDHQLNPNDPILFWHRLSLASHLLEYVNKRRERIQKNKPLQILSPSEGRMETPEFRTNYAQLIWEIMSETLYLQKVAYLALMDAEKYLFDKVPSIQSDDAKRFERGEYATLMGINLFRHTYNVVFVASGFKERAGGNYPALLILSLLHDFGKHKSIQADFKSEEYRRHEEISANYARSILTATGEFEKEYIDSICMTIATHHYAPIKGVVACDLLNESDKRAREYEKGGSYLALLP